MEKVRLEGELVLKMQGVQARSPQEAQQRAMIERTKVIDSIYLKYGTKLNYLQHALEYHGLKDDEDIKTLEVSFTMQAEQQTQNQQKKLELGEEEKKKVEEELAEFGPIVLTSSALLTLDAYIKAQQAITKLTFKLRNETESSHANIRRELLK